MVLCGYYGDIMILLLKYAVGLEPENLPVRIIGLYVSIKEHWLRIQQSKSFFMVQQGCQERRSVRQKMSFVNFQTIKCEY